MQREKLKIYVAKDRMRTKDSDGINEVIDARCVALNGARALIHRLMGHPVKAQPPARVALPPWDPQVAQTLPLLRQHSCSQVQIEAAVSRSCSAPFFDDCAGCSHLITHWWEAMVRDGKTFRA